MEQLTLGGIVRPVIVGIAGCSGSGKTTLARELALELEATLFPFDYYYRDLSHLPFDERAHSNFDHPDSLESELLLEHLEMLALSKPIARPIYDFATHTRVPGKTERVEPSQVILVEGILALHYAELRGLFDYSIYVDAPHEVCLMRRIHRDVRERGRTEASVKEQFEATALPMAEKYVLPSREFATLTVQGTDSLDWSVEQVLSQLHQRGLR